MVKQALDPEILSRYLENDLPEKEKARLERQLAKSPEARRQLESMQQMLETMRRLPDHAPPDGFLERLEQRLPPRKTGLLRWLTFGSIPAPVQALAAVLILTAAAVFVLRPQRTGDLQETALMERKPVSITRDDSLHRQEMQEAPLPAEDAAELELATPKTESVPSEESPARMEMGGMNAPLSDTIIEEEIAAFSSKPATAPQPELDSRLDADSAVRYYGKRYRKDQMLQDGVTAKTEEAADSPEDILFPSIKAPSRTDSPIHGEERIASDSSSQFLRASAKLWRKERTVTIHSASPARSFQDISTWLEGQGRPFETKADGRDEPIDRLAFLATPEEAEAIEREGADYFQMKFKSPPPATPFSDEPFILSRERTQPLERVILIFEFNP